MWSGSAWNVIYCENLSRRQKNILSAAAKAAFGRSLSHPADVSEPRLNEGLTLKAEVTLKGARQ